MKYQFYQSDRLNLDHVSEIKEVRSYNQFIKRYKTDNIGIGFGQPNEEGCIFQS